MIIAQPLGNCWTPPTQTPWGHFAKISLKTVIVLDLIVSGCLCQLQAGVYDFGLGFHGEKRGSWTPGEWLACVLLIMTILLGLAISIGLCYYVNRNQAQKATSRANYLRRQNLEMNLAPKRQPPSSGRQFSLSFERADDFEQQAQNERDFVNDSLAYQDYYNQNQRRQGRQQRQQQQQQRQTPDPSLVVQI